MQTQHEYKQVTFKEWITALKSGDYKQGPLALISADYTQHCCIGVYASMCGVPNEKLLDYKGSLELDEVFGLKTEVVSVLNTEALQGYSFYIRSTLAELNDRGHSFEQIADLITAYCYFEGIEQ